MSACEYVCVCVCVFLLPLPPVSSSCDFYSFGCLLSCSIYLPATSSIGAISNGPIQKTTHQTDTHIQEGSAEEGRKEVNPRRRASTVVVLLLKSARHEDENEDLGMNIKS